MPGGRPEGGGLLVETGQFGIEQEDRERRAGDVGGRQGLELETLFPRIEAAGDPVDGSPRSGQSRLLRELVRVDLFHQGGRAQGEAEPAQKRHIEGRDVGDMIDVARLVAGDGRQLDRAEVIVHDRAGQAEVLGEGFGEAALIVLSVNGFVRGGIHIHGS